MAQRDEIRVRLSPTGQKEVIAALRQVQAEAAVAARRTQGVFGQLEKSILGLRRLLPTIGLAAITTGIVALGRNALNTADQMGKMATRVGATAEGLSVLNFAAATADVETSKLQGSLIKLTRSIGDLQQGTVEQRDAFDKLKLSAADFAGLDTVQAFDLVAQRLGAMEAGIDRTEIASTILGRSGGELLTLMEDLAKNGFEEVAKRAAEAGQIISSDLAASAAAANDSMTLLSKQVQSTALQFIAGFGPELTQVMTNLRKDIETSAGSVEKIGKVIGLVFRQGINLAKLFGGGVVRTFSLVLGTVGKLAGGLRAALAQAFTLNFSGARNIIGELFSDITDDAKKFSEDSQKAWDEFSQRVTEKPVEARLALTLGGITPGSADAEAQLRSDVNKKITELEKLAGDAQLKQLREVADQRREILQASADAERELIAARASVGTQTASVQQELQAQEFAAIKERVDAARQGFQLEIQLARTKGDLLKQLAQNEIRDKAERERVINGINRQSTNEQLKASTDYFNSLVKLQSDYLKQYRTASETIKTLDKEVADGRKSQAEFENQIRLEGLSTEAKVAELRRQSFEQTAKLRSAVLRGDLEAAREFRNEVQNTARELNRLGDARGAKEAFADATRLFELAVAQNKLGAQQAKTEAQRGQQEVAKQLQAIKGQIDQLQRALVFDIKVGASQESLRTLVASIKEELERTTFNVNVQPSLLARASGGAIPALARGGQVPGSSPSPTADNILMWGTAGEWMHSVRAVRYYGTDFMRAVDSLQLPRFAEGGAVDGSSAGVAGDVSTLNLVINGRRLGAVSGSRDTIRGLVTAMKEVSVGAEER